MIFFKQSAEYHKVGQTQAPDSRVCPHFAFFCALRINSKSRQLVHELSALLNT